ncbi:MAG: T9SS type A sorting domain-containing protein [Bacteroidales bacterium]|nr:T9SS type A sorting domain-containing protein [Bacteroidales bacterium]
MKKHLLFFTAILIAGSVFAQDTITGWTFPVTLVPDSLNANLGLAGNLGYDIRFEGTDTTYNTIFFVDGTSDYAAATAGWDNGAAEKFWSIKFKAENYSTIKVSSAQSSDGANPGPKDFQLQWRLSGGIWEDIDEGAVTVADDWTTGVVTELPVPITGQGTSSIYIRWLITSTTNSAGGMLEPTGISIIDDILVTGINTLGVNEILFTNKVTVFPNPNYGIFQINTQIPPERISIYDMNGVKVYDNFSARRTTSVNLDLSLGLYLVKVLFKDSDSIYTTRMIVR